MNDPKRSMTILKTLSRREREILDVLYRLGEASVEDVRREIAGNPHYSTARAMLRVLEEKATFGIRKNIFDTCTCR